MATCSKSSPSGSVACLPFKPRSDTQTLETEAISVRNSYVCNGGFRKRSKSRWHLALVTSLATVLLIYGSTPLLSKENLLREGEPFSHYRIYFQFKAPVPLRYEILPYGNAKLLQAQDSQERLVILSRTMRMTQNIPSGDFLRPPGCAKTPDFGSMNGRLRCESIEQGVPLVRLIVWEKTAGLLHLLTATVQKEDLSLLDDLERTLEPQPAFYYPDDGL